MSIGAHVEERRQKDQRLGRCRPSVPCGCPWFDSGRGINPRTRFNKHSNRIFARSNRHLEQQTPLGNAGHVVRRGSSSLLLLSLFWATCSRSRSIRDLQIIGDPGSSAWLIDSCPIQNVSGNGGRSSDSSVLPGASAPCSEMIGHNTTTPGCSIVTRPAASASRMSSTSSKRASG